MKHLITAVALVALSGCASITAQIPSFWDPNQSHRIIDIRQRILELDCSQPQLPQALQLQRDLQWFQLYSESSGTRHRDVLRIIQPMQDTVADFVKRSQTSEGSKFYCETKKTLLAAQAQSAAASILGRF